MTTAASDTSHRRQCDTAEIIRAWNLIIEPGQVTELRALEATVGGDRFVETYSGFFDNPDAFARAAATIQKAANIYFVLNPIIPALLARRVNKIGPAKKMPLTGDKDISCRRWLPIDCDPERPAGISSTDREHNAAIEKARDVADFLRSRGFPEPIIGDSGNGGYVLCPIDESADDGGLIEKCLAAIHAAAGTKDVKIDVTCSNAARLWKIPGTLSGKGDADAAEIGRPQRLARILEAPDRLEVVPHEMLAALASEAPKPMQPINGKSNHQNNGNGKAFDLVGWMRNHGLGVNEPENWHGGKKWVLPTCPFNSDHTNASAVIVQKSDGKIGFKCHHDSCRGNDWHRLRELFEPDAYSNQKSRATVQQADEIKPPASDPVILNMANVDARRVSWVWPKRIPQGRLSMVVGMPGAGKSFALMDIAARISRGLVWPDGEPCEAGDVLLISGEDDPHDQIRPRLDACGADVSRVHLLSMVRRIGEDGKPLEVMFTLADIAALEIALQRIPNCKLVVVDPIGSFLGGAVDMHRDNEVRGILTPLSQVVERFNVAGLIIAHRRKAQSSHADDTALGSRAFTGLCRMVWHLSRDRDNRERRLLLPGKCNLCADPSGLAFTIEGDPARIVWEADAVEMTADEAMSAEESRPASESREDVQTWLRGELADMGEHPVEDIREAAGQAGFNWRRVQRAREDIGALVHRASFGGAYIWRLLKPGQGDTPCHTKKHGTHGTQGKIGVTQGKGEKTHE